MLSVYKTIVLLMLPSVCDEHHWNKKKAKNNLRSSISRSRFPAGRANNPLGVAALILL
jgi:hypothetical protein